MDYTKKLCKRGFVSTTLFRYIEIAKRYDVYIYQGVSRMDALQRTADDFGIGDRTVYNAINSFR